MKTKIAFALAAALALNSCAAFVDPLIEIRESSIKDLDLSAEITGMHVKKFGQDKTITEIKKFISDSLKDPSSAQFKNFRLVDFAGGKLACGELNGKNSYGAYTGFTPFVAGVADYTEKYTKSNDQAYRDAKNAGLYAACGK